jgi:hypothetical protein
VFVSEGHSPAPEDDSVISEAKNNFLINTLSIPKMSHFYLMNTLSFLMDIL